MSRVELPHALHSIAEKGFVDCDDVARLRLQVFAQGVVSPGEAQALFWLNESTCRGLPEWGTYFASALSDHFVHHQWPQGYVDDAGADRLATSILRDGRIATANELELLVSIIENSSSTPEQLVLFALGEVRATVFTGRGPTRKGVPLDPGVITPDEVALVERVIYGLAAQGCPALSRAGAEILFDLNRKISNAGNPSRWSGLFINAIAGYVMAGRAWQAPQKETKKTKEPAKKSAKKLAISTAKSLVKKSRKAPPSVAHKTSDAEAAWLVSRIGNDDGKLCGNERELLQYIDHNADQIHPALKALIDRAA